MINEEVNGFDGNPGHDVNVIYLACRGCLIFSSIDPRFVPSLPSLISLAVIALCALRSSETGPIQSPG